MSKIVLFWVLLIAVVLVVQNVYYQWDDPYVTPYQSVFRINVLNHYEVWVCILLGFAVGHVTKGID